VDGGGSLRCALLGDNIAEMAYKNGWSVSGPPQPSACCVRMPRLKPLLLPC
jgi:hypothetical protein